MISTGPKQILPKCFLLLVLTVAPFSCLPVALSNLQQTGGSKTASTITTIITTTNLPCLPINFQGQLSSFTSHISVDSCKEMTRKLNSVAPSTNSSCPWEYTCEFKANRFPQYIIQANCLKTHCAGCSEDGSREPGVCEAVEIPLTVYECSNEDQYGSQLGSIGINTGGEWIKEHVRVACQCEHNVIDSV